MGVPMNRKWKIENGAKTQMLVRRGTPNADDTLGRAPGAQGWEKE